MDENIFYKKETIGIEKTIGRIKKSKKKTINNLLILNNI
jgi:hypothetical protein